MIKIFLILMLACGVAQAVEWMPVNQQNQAGVTVYVDGTSISKKNGIVKAWTMFENTAHQETKGGQNPEKYMSLKQLAYIRCKDNTIAMSQVVLSSEPPSAREIADSQRSDADKLNFDDVTPGSMADSVIKYACSKYPPG